MIEWLHVTLIAVSGSILALILVLILRRCFHSRTRNNSVISDEERGRSLRNGISRLHQMNQDLERDASKKANYYVLRSTKKPKFSWSDHPSLITDAVENGWSRFAFTALISSPSVKSAKSLLGVCAAGDPVDVEIAWEVCEGSADFMQKIRLNPGFRKSVASVGSSMGAVSVIRTALPLPGPHLGNSSFPQEAYFEITILSCNENIHDHLVDKERNKPEGEKIKLIGEDFNAKMNSDSLNHASGRNRIEDMKVGGKKDGKNEAIFLSVGFTGGGTTPLKNPGSYPGSIGFNSSGSVYLDGIKLVFDSGKEDWARIGKVIGCGYNPSQKKVFFTSDSQLVHEIHCKTEEFSSPLYPTIAVNTDVTVLVNLGQSPFKFLPGNRHRTPNPCFIGPMLGNSPSLGYEDSRELFSMGRIDSQWLQRSAMRSNNNTVNSVKGLEYDMESEGDLFEIVLDSTGRSPYAATHQ